MNDLWNAPYLKIDQPSSALTYEISDGQGAPLGRGTQAAGPEPRKFGGRLFGSGVSDERVVVQIAALDGVPRIYVDRAPGSPIAIVAPDGTVLGRFQKNMAAEAASFLQGAQQQEVGSRTLQSHYRILDGADRPVCDIAWEEVEIRRGWTLDTSTDQAGDVTYGQRPSTGGRYCTITDMAGTQIARMDLNLDAVHQTVKDGYYLQINYQLPEPLRSLVIATPIAYDMTRDL
ncbi:hypothetical protein J4573_44935 [Actinomadura barringtoniae]|uniref:Uncharacterized protein n=1 Tax=Actinomadura barringtoniae TaxID=1427535 RepID=A0A939T8M4_9ACTN|nr:hypothetical protein [Actinomadura barringtoniae]MBO2454298.1 hypothetical protein [Actinomadura barringtoniae]